MGASPQGRNVGQVLSKGEARRLSRETGKPISEIAGRAIDKGVGIGSALGNQISRGMPSPTGLRSAYGGVGSNMGGSPESLEGLRGLQMQKGQAYYGSTTTTTPGRPTTTTPIVLPRGFSRAVPGAQPDSGMRQAVTPPPPGIRRKDMGSYTPESLEARYTQAADRVQARSEQYASRAERTTGRSTGRTKPRDVIQRQRQRAEDLKQKADAYRTEATNIRSRMSPPAM